ARSVPSRARSHGGASGSRFARATSSRPCAETRTPRGEEVPRGGIRLLRRSEGLALARPRRRNPGSVEQSALIAAAVSVRTSGGADFGADRCRQGGGRVRLRSVGTSGGRGIFADPPAAVV